MKLFLSLTAIQFILGVCQSHAQSRDGMIAMIQYDANSHFGDYTYNLNALSRYAEEAVSNHADIVAFPEGSTYGYTDEKSGRVWCLKSNSDPRCQDVSPVAEAIPNGPTTRYWKKFARLHHIYVVYNLPERTADGKYYNTTAVAGPMGFVTKYRKIILYSTDKFYASPGKSYSILKTPFGNFGLMICMDATHTGLMELYKQLGVNAALLIMDWDDAPDGPYGARGFFQKRARESNLDIYATDLPAWDGTGMYPKDGSARERSGLADIAIQQSGISYHVLHYPSP